MPKASMNLDNDTPPSKNNIGLAGQVGTVKSITVPKAVKHLPND